MDSRLKSIYGKHTKVIIDALDIGNYKVAITLCNKWIKKATASPLLLVIIKYFIRGLKGLCS